MHNSMKKISIIMPTYNGIGTIEKAVTSIFKKSTYKQFELIIIDDGSPDDTTNWAVNYDNKANMTYVRLPHQGICTALNKGFQIAGDNDVIRMDNDAVVITDDWIEKFIDTAYSDNSIGIVSCCPIRDNGRIHSCEVKVISKNYISSPPSCSVKHDPAMHNRVFEVESAWLPCAFIKNNVIKACTNDENYNPVWVEDVDYCMQARKARFKIMCNQNIKINHTSPPERKRGIDAINAKLINDKNKRYFQKKWWPFCDYAFIKNNYKNYPEIIKYAHV